VSPDPSFPMHDTESDPRWGWLSLDCETTSVKGNFPTYMMLTCRQYAYMVYALSS